MYFMVKIIILEDEEVLGRVYKKNLEKAGYEVTWVETISGLEDVIKTENAKVVLVDHGIKGYKKSGADVVPIIRKSLPDSKIIMLSNYSHADVQRQALNAGANDFLVKLNTPPKVLVSFIDNLGIKD